MLKIKCLQVVLILFTLVQSVNVSQAQEKFPLNLVPADANVITCINLKDLLNSEVSKQEGWQQLLEERFQNGITAVPPGSDSYMLACKAQPFTPQKLWSIGMLKLPAGITFADLAKHEGANVEQLAGRNAFSTARNEYVVEMPGEMMLKFIPGQRQEIARYIKGFQQSDKPKLSSYLQNATAQNAHVVMALDMQDMIEPAMVKRYLMEDNRFSGHRQLVDKLVKLLAGLQGIQVRHTISKNIDTEVQLDFAEDVGTSGFSVKAILMGILDDMGAYVGELDKAEVQTTGKSVILKARLSDQSFRFILSFVIPSRIAADEYGFQPMHKPAVTKKTKPALTPEEATANYITSVNKMLGDLQKAMNVSQNSSRIHAWHDNFARKIRDLDKTGVSPKALEFGDNIAHELQLIASSLRGDMITVNNLEGAIVYQYQYNPGYVNYNPWGWNFGYQQGSYNVTSNLQQIREQQSAAVNKSAKERELIWNNIQKESASMERLALKPKP